MDRNQNLLLWEVYFMASYYDNDERMPGSVPVDERMYIVAATYDEALAKAEPKLKKLRKKYKKDEQETKAYPVPLEGLLVARDSSRDGRMGYHSTQNFKAINLSLDDDQKKYRLVISLIEK